jgi:hypothetical protein
MTTRERTSDPDSSPDSSTLASASVSPVIARAEQLLKDITPGAWAVAPCSDTDETRDVVAGYSERIEGGRTIKQAEWIAELSGDFDFDTDEEAEFQKIEANAQFIAAAPQLVRDLVSSLTRLQQGIEQVREEIAVTATEEREISQGMFDLMQGWADRLLTLSQGRATP